MIWPPPDISGSVEGKPLVSGDTAHVRTTSSHDGGDCLDGTVTVNVGGCHFGLEIPPEVSETSPEIFFGPPARGGTEWPPPVIKPPPTGPRRFQLGLDRVESSMKQRIWEWFNSLRDSSPPDTPEYGGLFETPEEE